MRSDNVGGELTVSTTHVFSRLFNTVACCSMLVSVTSALAQTYPAKTIRIIQGAAAGGSLDSTARIYAQRLTESLGQSVIVEARPGAGGTIANDRVAKSAADGYTLLVMAATGAIQSALRTDLPYDLERDLAPISLLSITPLVLVAHPSVPARTLQELVVLARKNPGKLNYGSSGVGSTSHLAGEALNLLGKVKLVHVPFKGGAESVLAAASGEVDVSLPGITPVPGLVKVGKLRALAVTTIDRSPLLPSTPTFNESGFPGYDFSSWAGLLAPAGTPKPVIDRLNGLVTTIGKAGDLKEVFEKQGLSVRATTVPEFTDFIQRELALNRKLAKTSGIKWE